ncbi:DUF883 C-terminal domain-containing protein [Sulfitobacter sp. HNIBRBA2951]|uniref:DUF883 C-terminal domain-containing protein n=1 Tax=Sulfitobacter aquimarinus TaxID=3158557 RepID=UPI0032DFF6BE
MTKSKATASKSKTTTSDVEPKHIGEDTLNSSKDNVAQAAFGRAKEAMPSFDDMAETLKAQTNVDIQNLAADATTFVRRNPAVSLAAAVGVGALIGILATKRS